MIFTNRRAAATLMTLIACLLNSGTYAHSPLCDCYDNGDDTVTCEGGFSDGSSAAGIDIRVMNGQEKVLLAGKMDEHGQYSFTPPAEDYHVVFDAGENHSVTVYSDDIVE